MRRIGRCLLASSPRRCRYRLAAETVVTISKSQQRLAVTVDGVELHRWPVSTGRRGLDTPSGTFRPIRFERKWYSRKYDMSPMPYSVFFHGGYAVHGTYETRRLGQAGLAWLRAAVAGERGGAVFAAAQGRQGRYPHRGDRCSLAGGAHGEAEMKCRCRRFISLSSPRRRSRCRRIAAQLAAKPDKIEIAVPLPALHQAGVRRAARTGEASRYRRALSAKPCSAKTSPASGGSCPAAAGA